MQGEEDALRLGLGDQVVQAQAFHQAQRFAPAAFAHRLHRHDRADAEDQAERERYAQPARIRVARQQHVHDRAEHRLGGRHEPGQHREGHHDRQHDREPGQEGPRESPQGFHGGS